MQLDATKINQLESLIDRANIPYEETRIELIDHIATMIEEKMEDNSRLTFGQALSNASFNFKATVFQIRLAVKKRTIESMVRESLDFSDWMASGIVILFTTLLYRLFLAWGYWGAPVGSGYLIISLFALLIVTIRMRKIDTSDNYDLHIRKVYAWVPLVAIGGICLAATTLFLSIIQTNIFGSYFEKIILIFVTLPFGIFIKTVMDVTIFNVTSMKEKIELDQLFIEPLCLDMVSDI